jgi:hypothetical protein
MFHEKLLSAGLELGESSPNLATARYIIEFVVERVMVCAPGKVESARSREDWQGHCGAFSASITTWKKPSTLHSTQAADDSLQSNPEVSVSALHSMSP